MINVTAAAENCTYSVEEIKAFADVKTTTSWESMAGSQGSRRRRREQLVSPPQEPTRAAVDPGRDLRLDPASLDKMLRGACDALIQAEPDLTKCELYGVPLSLLPVMDEVPPSGDANDPRDLQGTR